MLEGVAVLLVIVTFVSVAMSGAYLWFARGWIQYQSEQSLYCVAESQPQLVCRRTFTKNIQRFLPFGTLRRPEYSQAHGEVGIKTEWNWKWEGFGYKVRVDKKLRARKIPRHILAKGASL